MPAILFILFVIVPILEIATFIQIGSLFGLVPTLLGILITAIIGAFLVRQQGFKALNDARANLESNKSPIEQVIHGVFILAAGLLLLTPGFLTDTIGFIFLIPPFRLRIARSIWSWLKTNATVSTFGAQYDGHTNHANRNPKDDKTIDGEAVEVRPEEKKLPRILN